MSAKDIEIALKLTGVNPKDLDPLVTAFTSLDQKITAVEATFTKFGTSIKSFKVPAGLTSFVNSVDKLGKVDVAPITELGKALTTIGKITKMPPIGAFVNSVLKLSELKGNTEALAGLAKSLKTLSTITKFPPMATLAANLSKIASVNLPPNLEGFVVGLKSLGSIGKIPDLTPLVNSITSLGSVQVVPKIGTLVNNLARLGNLTFNSLTATVNNLTRLAAIQAFPSMATLVNNLARLGTVTLPNISDFVTSLTQLSAIPRIPPLTALANSLNQFRGLVLPNMVVFAVGLNRLATINIATVVANLQALYNALLQMSNLGQFAAFATLAQNFQSMAASSATVQQALNPLINTLNQLGVNAGNTSRSVKSLAESFATVLKFRAISEIIIGLQTSFKEGIASIIDYDQALKDLQAITGATNTEVAQMGLKILEVASKTKFSAAEVAAGMRTLGQAGFNARESITAIQSVADLATGTLSDMAQTVDLLTTTMRVFNIDASRSQEVADTFANAINRSKLTVEKLRTAMNYVGPIAQDANMEFSELSAAMMTLANAGIRASTIGTALRQVLSELVDPSKKFKEAAANAGVALQDMNPEVQDFSTVLANLRIVLKDTGTSFDIFGKRGSSAALILAKNGQYDRLLATVSETGTAAKMAGIQIEGLGLKFKNLRDRLGVLAIAIGETGLNGFLHTLVGILQKSVIAMTSFTEASGELTMKLVATVAAFSALLVAINSGTIITAWNALVSYTAQVVLFTKAAWAAATAQGTWNALIAANPYAMFGALLLSIIASTWALRKEVKDTSEAYAILASQLGNASKQMQDYLEKIVHLKEGSRELKNENLRLRQTLVDIAKSNKDLAESANRVILAIDPLNGTFHDSTELLRNFQDEVDKFQFDAIMKSIKEIPTTLTKPQGFFTEMYEGIKKYGSLSLNYLTYFSAEFQRFQVKLYTLTRPQGMADWLGWSKEHMDEQTTALKNAANEAVQTEKSIREVKKALNEQTMSWEELQRVILSWGGTTNKTQLEIMEHARVLSERMRSLLDLFILSGKVKVDTTEESFLKLTETLKLSKLEADILLSTFKEFVSLAPPANIFEKWIADPGSIEIIKNFKEFETLYKQFGGTIDERQKAELEHIVKVRKQTLQMYQELQLKKPGMDATEQEWGTWLTQVRFYLNHADKEMRDFSENQLGQLMLTFNQMQEDLNKKLAENRVKFDGDLESMARNAEQIKHESDTAILALFKGLVDSIGESAEESAKKVKESYSKLKGVFSDLEKEADRSFSNISKHANDQSKSQLTVLSGWVQQIGNEMVTMGAEVSFALKQFGQGFVDAFNAGASDEALKQIETAIKEVTESGIENFKSMGEAIISVLDKIMAKEDEILEKAKKTADDFIAAKQKVKEFLLELDQSGFTEQQKFNADRKRANDLHLQALKLIEAAEKETGLTKTKMLEEANRLSEKAFSIAQSLKLTGKEEVTAAQQLKNEKEKIKNIESQEWDLRKQRSFARTNEERAQIKERLDALKIEKESQEQVAAQKEKEIKAGQAQIAAQRKAAKDYEEAQKSIAEQQMKAHEEELKAFTEFKAEVLTLQTEVEKFKTSLLGVPIQFEQSPEEIFAGLNAQWALTTEEGAKAWEATYENAVNTIDGIISKLAELPPEQPWTLNLQVAKSPAGPWSEKLEEAKKEFLAFVEEISQDISVTIKLLGYDTLMKQLNTIIDTLAQIVSKTITVTVKYATEGKPSTSSSETKIGGYATGGPVFKRLRNPHLPGWGQEDDVPALLTKGEFVFKKEAVKKYGVNFLHALNSMRLSPTLVPKFATGGLVGNITKGFNNFSALGKHSVGKLSSVFSSTLQRFKTGGNVASDDLQNTILSITERYNRLIQNARDTGDRDIELVLQKELIEIQRIAEELQRQLEALRLETEQKRREIQDELAILNKARWMAQGWRAREAYEHVDPRDIPEIEKFILGDKKGQVTSSSRLSLTSGTFFGIDTWIDNHMKRWQAEKRLELKRAMEKIDENDIETKTKFEFDAEASIKKIQTDSILERQKIENNLKDEIVKLEDAMLQEIERARKEVSTVTPLQGRGSKGIAWFNKGGLVDKVQGAIKGKDSVGAMLTPGEYVMKESVVRALGANFFENLNKWGRMAVRPLHFAEGGLVPGSSLSTSSSIQESSMRIDLNLNGRSFAMKSDPGTAKMLARELRKLKLTTA